MESFDVMHRANAEYLERLYQQYLANPHTLDAQWLAFFKGFEFGYGGHAPAVVPAACEGVAASDTPIKDVYALVHAYRELGHGIARLDPLGHNRPIRVGTFPLTASGRAHCLDATAGLVKVIGDARSDRLLGLHILAARASDLIAEGVLAMEFAASVEDLALTVHAHPTLSETLREASWVATQRALHYTKRVPT